MLRGGAKGQNISVYFLLLYTVGVVVISQTCYCQNDENMHENENILSAGISNHIWLRESDISSHNMSQHLYKPNISPKYASCMTLPKNSATRVWSQGINKCSILSIIQHTLS